MPRKRVNKNLVAFLTIMGILLTVVVVTIAAHQGAAKDPDVWAQQARQREAAGEYETAIQLYNRAYRDSMDVSYLVEAAECAYRLGEVGTAFGQLQRAYAEQRTKPGAPVFKVVLHTYLDRTWELNHPEAYWRQAPWLRDSLLEYALALQEVDDQDVLGPISEAVARWAMEAEDPENRARGDAALQRAVELDEANPRVVMARMQRRRQEVTARLSELRQGGATDGELRALRDNFTQEVLALLKAGVEVHPGEWDLVGAYVGELQGQGQSDEARAVVAQALAARDDDPDLQCGVADFFLEEARRGRAELTPAAYAELLDAAAQHAGRAIELAPGLYEAYVARAKAELMRGAQGTDAAVAPETFEAVMQMYDDAIQRTAGIRSLHATLGARLDRRLMHIHAFVTALQYYLADGTPEEKQARLEWVHRFLEETRKRYPTEAFTFYMQGQTDTLAGRLTPAIQAFEQAEQLATADRQGYYPEMWLRGFRGVLPVHRLALLYRGQNQPGESLRYTEQALQQYEALGRLPPLLLAVNRAELFNMVNRPPQRTLDYVAELCRVYAEQLASPDSESERLRLAAVEAAALQRLERGAEARERLAAVAQEDARALLIQAGLANTEQDYETVEACVRELLARDDLTPDLALGGLRLLVPVLVQQEEHAQAKELLAGLRQRFSEDEGLLRAVDRYEVVLSYSDPEEVNAKFLELIAAEPDPILRARQYFDHYVQRGDYDQAGPYLEELEAALPDDPNVLANQFVFAIRAQEFERAERYVVKLSQLNEGRGADNAGGATYRARLALARGKADESVRAYREAQDKLPRSSALQAELARALLLANRVEEAVGALQEAVELNPRNFDALILLDETLVRAVPLDKRPEDWETYLEQAAKLRPRHAYILEQADRLDPQAGIKAREARRAAEPENIDNLIRLAQLYASKEVGDNVRAAECFQQALKLEPGNRPLAQAAAAFYARTGQREAGEEHLRAYLEAQQGKERGLAQALLGAFYRRLGDAQAAEEAYERARRLIEELVPDREERRLALLEVELALVSFYRDLGGREAEMIAACRWVLDKLDPKDERDTARIQYARLTILRGLMTLNRLGDAEQELAAYAKAYPHDPNAELYRAQLKLMQRDWDEAYGALSRVLQSSPDHVWCLLRRGSLSIRHGRYGEAREDLMRARTLTKATLEQLPEERQRNSQEAMVYLNACSELAGLYEITEQYELAESELREMMELVVAHPDAGMTQPQVAERLLRLYRRAKRPEKAQQVISEFMARYPRVPFWPLQFGSLRTTRGEELSDLADAAQKAANAAEERRYRAQAAAEFEAAAAHYQRAEQIAQRSSPGEAIVCLAYQLDALAAAGRTERAAELYERLRTRLERVPAIIHAAMIRVYETDGEREQALAALEQALRTACQEGFSTVTNVMGFAGAHLPTEAVVEALQRMADGTPADSAEGFLLRNVLAERLLKAGRPAEVLRVVEPVIANAPPESPERLSALLARQQALLKSGDAEGAIELLESILETWPDNRSALNNLAYVLADEVGRAQEALPYAERVRELASREPAVLDTLGWVYLKNGRFEEAEAAFKEALSIDAEYVAATYHLGVLCAERGRVVEARTAFSQALELATKQKDRKYQQQAREALQALP